MHMVYRLRFSAGAAPEQGHRTLLHFGSVDWSTSVHLNGEEIGSHVGGYDGFSFDITDLLTTSVNELVVVVFDPSDAGNQPNGKQRISSIDKPGGDMYTPNSGIWQTVWLERVPRNFIKLVKIDQASTTTVKVIVEISTELTGNLSVGVLDDGEPLAYSDFINASQGQHVALLTIIDPKLWSPEHPYLYDLKITFGDDLVFSYFGLRTFTVGTPPSSDVTRPLLNGAFTFLAGFLDQSWWPDGQYTAPTDEALESDVVVTKEFGLNMIRLHQKVNPERWYYHADRHGLIVFQDMVQKYGRATLETIPLFQRDLAATVVGRGNHPCIVQWTLFNEEDCWAVFNTTPGLPYMVRFLKSLDPTRPVDVDSGGRANAYHLADVNDIHSYPFPAIPALSTTQYAMVGEYGGLGIFVKDKEWVSGGCYGYLPQKTVGEGASTYVNMTSTFIKNMNRVSAAVYTQTTDVELECDGFLNYDRSHKFTEEQRKSIRNANIAMIEASKPGVRERVFV
jgi:beta-galactosidase/beta-glucuronidase